MTYNPFSDPFADSDVTAARGSSAAAANNDTLKDFNPFEKDQFAPAAVLSTSSELPAYEDSSATTSPFRAATDDLKRRQEELDEKAAALEQRERELHQNNQQIARINNFPPLPACCPLKSCFYQDIELDIPASFKLTVKLIFYSWMVYCILLFINIFGCLAYFIASIKHGDSNQSGLSFGLSIVYFCLWTPASFVCWFRPAYNAFRNDSSFYFFVFFFIMLFQFAASIVQCLGIAGSGTVGYLSGLTVISHNTGVGIFMLVIGALFTAMAAIFLVLLLRVHNFYRSSGASFSKAQQEFAQGVVTNRTVQETASGVASAAARSTVDSYTGVGTSADYRY